MKDLHTLICVRAERVSPLPVPLKLFHVVECTHIWNIDIESVAVVLQEVTVGVDWDSDCGSSNATVSTISKFEILVAWSYFRRDVRMTAAP